MHSGGCVFVWAGLHLSPSVAPNAATLALKALDLATSPLLSVFGSMPYLYVTLDEISCSSVHLCLRHVKTSLSDTAANTGSSARQPPSSSVKTNPL